MEGGKKRRRKRKNQSEYQQHRHSCSSNQHDRIHAQLGTVTNRIGRPTIACVVDCKPTHICLPSSVLFAERDTNADVLTTWIYPELSDELRVVVERKCAFLGGQEAPTEETTLYGVYGSTWYYIYGTPVAEGNGIPDAEAYAVVVFADAFSPEKYLHMARVFAAQYAVQGSGVDVLTAFMGAAMQGECSSPDGEDTFAVSTYSDVRHTYLKTAIKPLINKFGIESILIYIAVLLKKRIVVVSSDATVLQDVVRTLPQFAYKRQDWTIIHPNVDTANDEVADLVASGSSYIAGFTDNSVAIREDLYDLLVDANGGAVSYASHAQGSFGMGKIHKEIAMYMVEAAQDETVTQREVLKALMVGENTERLAQTRSPPL